MSRGGMPLLQTLKGLWHQGLPSSMLRSSGELVVPLDNLGALGPAQQARMARRRSWKEELNREAYCIYKPAKDDVARGPAGITFE
jgi:hypothetical protein